MEYCNSTESNLSVQDFIREAVAEKLAKVTTGIPDNELPDTVKKLLK